MEQKQRHLEIAQDMLDNANSNPNFLNTVITGDESWVYGYDPEPCLRFHVYFGVPSLSATVSQEPVSYLSFLNSFITWFSPTFL
jgi:hypothetical protein